MTPPPPTQIVAAWLLCRGQRPGRLAVTGASDPHVVSYRTLTVHGAGVALAMLRGHKPCDLRVSDHYPAGWYNLHVGRRAIDSQIWGVVEATWSTEPLAVDNLPRCAIYGQVYLGRMLKAADVKDPWIPPLYVGCVYVIEASMEFVQPIVNVTGSRGCWFVKGTAVRDDMRNALVTATHRQFVERTPGLRDFRRCTAACRIGRPWACRAGTRK